MGHRKEIEPFITDRAMMSIMTPKRTPSMEIVETKESKPVRLRARLNRTPMKIESILCI
jgi:hypothetical protein